MTEGREATLARPTMLAAKTDPPRRLGPGRGGEGRGGNDAESYGCPSTLAAQSWIGFSTKSRWRAVMK